MFVLSKYTLLLKNSSRLMTQMRGCCTLQHSQKALIMEASTHTKVFPSHNCGSPVKSQDILERGASFATGQAFYRAESAQSRDLAVLAASLHSRSIGRRLRVLDVMAGSGARGARYALQGGASMVWCNDIDTRLNDTLRQNLLRAAGIQHDTPPETLKLEGLKREVWQWDQAAGSGENQEVTDPDGSPRHMHACAVRVSHADASRLLASCWMNETFFDLIDIDSFGSDTSHLGHAIDAVSHHGGLLYLTSTDGFTSGGLRPARSLAAFGAYARSVPWANEQGLRMLVGAAVREGATKGVRLTPIFSLYAFHGPVFRVMLRVHRSREWAVQHYGFVGHCHVHANTYTVGWDKLSKATCRCCRKTGGEEGVGGAGRQQGDPGLELAPPPPQPGTPLVLSGPMWTGPLHSSQDVKEMAAEAAARGWTGHGVGSTPAEGRLWAAGARSKKNHPRPLEEVLQVMVEEADTRLPVGFTNMDAIASRLVAAHPGAAVPGRDKLLAQLRAEGWAAARCHLDPSSIRTNARMCDILATCLRAHTG